tara:strand:+ start:71 stop:724 length:654 start_codon:yes stop_codon:yes gene_type:complete
MRVLLPLLAFLPTIGCGGAAYSYSGYWTADHFPIDDDWIWEYSNEGEVFNILATTNDRTKDGSTEIVTIDYTNKDTGSMLYMIKWSSDKDDGVLVHGYYVEEPLAGQDDSDATTGEWVKFSSPVELASRQMSPKDSITTTVDGITYESTFEAFDTCENEWVGEEWQCMRIVVSSDAEFAAPFEGTWNWASEWGTSSFQPTDSSFAWKLVGQPDFDPN